MNKATPVLSKCDWCGEEDGGPWSGMALLTTYKYIHPKCEAAWMKSNKKSKAAMNVLNDFFAKDSKKR